MKRIIVLLVLFASVLQACTDRDEFEGKINAGSAATIYATIEGQQTKVQLNDQMKTVWTANDKIVVLGNDKVAFYTFTGNTGDRNATFNLNGAVDYDPESTIYDYGENYYALYPSVENLGDISQIKSQSVLAFFREAPTLQNYIEGSYDPEANIMIGTSTNGTSFAFKNLLGYLKLSFTGSKKVRSITLSGNNNEYISGKAAFTVNNYSLYSWYGTTTRYTSITLDCSEAGVQLSESPTDFYFALVPTYFSKGITIEVTFTDETSFIKSTTKTITINRNAIQPMAALSTDNAAELQICKILFTGANIEGLAFEGTPSMSGYVDWGDGSSQSSVLECSSHSFAGGSGTYTITASLRDATTVTLTSCKGVSSIDLSQF